MVQVQIDSVDQGQRQQVENQDFITQANVKQKMLDLKGKKALQVPDFEDFDFFAVR